MKLALKIPRQHFKELAKYTDILLVDPVTSLYADLEKKEIWVHGGSVSERLNLAKELKAKVIIAPSSPHDPRYTEYQIRNLVELQREQKTCFEVAGYWWGFKKDLVLLSHLCTHILLPSDKLRTQEVQNGDSGLYWYHGFRTLEELVKYPPKGLITDMPIKAAIFGVSLEHRERKPSLPDLDPNLKLTDNQLEAVVSNITLMRKAAKGLI